MIQSTEHDLSRDAPPIQVSLLPVVVLDKPQITFKDAVRICKETAGPILVKCQEVKLVVMPMEYYSKHFARIKEHG